MDYRDYNDYNNQSAAESADIHLIDREKNLQVTTLTDLKRYAQGTVVRLPDFTDGQPLIARVKRPSFMQMVRAKRIPNALLIQANKLFLNGGETALDEDNENVVSDMMQILEIVADETLISPTLKEIKECGMELTDQQLMVLFNYTQNGMSALSNFRS